MQIKLARTWKNPVCTTGQISIDGEPRYFSLELPELFEGQSNVNDKCCIPVGTYKVTRFFSPKRQYFVGLLHDVPGRSMIEMHIGNFPHDTDGCILLGMRRINDYEIAESAVAFESFMEELTNALASEQTVEITIQ